MPSAREKETRSNEFSPEVHPRCPHLWGRGGGGEPREGAQTASLLWGVRPRQAVSRITASPTEPGEPGRRKKGKGDESRGVGRFISPRPCCPHTHQPQDTNNKCSQEGDARSKRASLLLYPEGSRESKSGSKVREGERRGIQPEPRPCTKYPAGMTQRFSALWASFRAETTNPIYRSRKLESKSEAYPLDRICTRTPNSNTSVNPGFLRALHSKPKLW